MKKINLKINGQEKQLVISPKTVLIDILREGMNLTGTKQSCDRKGQCGACTVIVNGKTLKSCLTKVAKLEGANIISIEGLGTTNNPHLIQEAFVLSGAIQCGFCIPGMIMATKGLLDQNLNPTTEEIKYALRQNICRCTGYIKIIDAVQLAARFLRGEVKPEEVKPRPSDPKIGISHPRPSGLAKACGTAIFGADIKLEGVLELAVVRSPHKHALIKSIDTSEAEKMPGVVGVITAKDIKGTNRMEYVVADRPVICDDKVRIEGDAVAAVVATTKTQALAAVEMVMVNYERLPEINSPAEAMANGAIQIHQEFPNLCYRQPVIKGDAQKAFEDAAYIVEDHFKTQCNHQAPLEPEVSVAYMEGKGEDATLVVVGRVINIHKGMEVIQKALGYENIRYEEAFTGGQFGIKLEVITEPITAAAALHFNQPVRYVPTLEESILITPKRHPFDMTIKLGADKKGKLTALEMDITVDNGCYHSIGNIILNRALHMLSSSYYIPNINVASRLVYTNNPWGSAARGAGPPQTHFALECAIDLLAEKLNIDKLALREKNTLKPGQSKATGHIIDEWNFLGLCEAAKTPYEEAIQESTAHKTGKFRHGVGLGAAAFGVAMPGDQAMTAVELEEDDCVTIYAAVADPGEGNDSMLSQLVAHVLKFPLDQVRLISRDTSKTPATGPASGSRMTYMAGGATVDAAQKLRKAMDDVGSNTYQAFQEAKVPTRYMGTKKTLAVDPLNPNTGQGPSFEVEVHSIQMAEVEVNTETGETKILKMTTFVDTGPIINPLNVEGQLEGGMDMGAGYALREEYIQNVTMNWKKFKFPTMKTSFDMAIVTRETPRKRGTLGSVGCGEMSMVATAPAIINAIYDACGVMVCDLPATPEKVKAALKRV